MIKPTLYFALGIVVALLALVVVASVVAGCSGGDPVSTSAPTATPRDAMQSGTPAQPAPTTAASADAPNTTATQPAPTYTPSVAASRDLDIVTLLRKDAIPAILEPEFLTVAEADEQMQGDELVIGVSIDGDSRAYSVNMLSRHEIANDVVGGKSVAVTW